MPPLYFPFTSVSRRLMEASSEFFKRMTVYQVSAALIPERMQAWQDEQRLDIRLPQQHHEKLITAILREYWTWAQHHQGGDISFFKTQGRRIPFFDGSSVSQIRKEIKTRRGTTPSAGETDAPDLYPAVFLQMAQDLDEKNREIAGELESQATREQELMQALKGDDAFQLPGDVKPGREAEDQEAYMISERMAAWARFMLADDLVPDLLITSHPTVLDDLVERAALGSHKIEFIQNVKAPIGDAGNVSRYREALAAFLEDMSVLAWDGEKEGPRFTVDGELSASSVTLSVYLIPGLTPRALLERYVTSGGPDPSGTKRHGDAMRNTVVGVLEP